MLMSGRHQQPLRLPRDVAERARRQADRKKISVNTYVQLALEAKLEADEARQQQRAEDRRQGRKGNEVPRGLGLGLRRPEMEPLPAAIEGPAPVVVNVGTKEDAAGEGTDLIAGLAAYVMGGPAFERERRQRTAVDILRNHGKTAGERGGLVRQLDQALAALKTQRPTLTSLGDIGSLFR